MVTFASKHHSFDIDLAGEYGIHGAILIHHFQHWITVNRKLNQNFREGRTWTYQTIDWIEAHFAQYMTTEQIKYAIRSLVKAGVLIKGNFNKMKWDRTVWYAFQDEERYVGAQIISPKGENSQMHSGNLPNGEGKIPRPIPDTIPDPETHISEAAPTPRKKNPPATGIVTLTLAEEQSLIKRFGAVELKRIIEELQDHCDSKGRTYVSWPATIRNWARREDKFFKPVPKSGHGPSRPQASGPQFNRDAAVLAKAQQLYGSRYEFANSGLMLGHNYIEFHREGASIRLEVGMDGFTNKLIDFLRSKKHDVTELERIATG